MSWPIVTGSLLFAVNGTVAKLAMEAGLGPTDWSSCAAWARRSCWSRPRSSSHPAKLRPSSKREVAVLALLGVVGVALVQWFYLVAISRLPVGLALLIEYTAPLIVALWARFVFREQVHARVWWALAACMAGLTLVAQVGDGVTLDVIGLLAAGGAAVALATYDLLGDRLLTTRDPLTTHAWSIGFAALFWVVLQPLWTFPTSTLGIDVPLPATDLQPPMWLFVVWIILLGTVVPYLLFLVGIKRVGAARAGLLGMVEPVAASATAWIVLGESMTAVQLFGGAVVIAGVVLAETARRHRDRESDHVVLPDTVAT